MQNPVLAQLAQSPLATNAAPVKPNILLMLDTSGSMSSTGIQAPHIIQANGGWLENFTSTLLCAGYTGLGYNDETIDFSPYHNDIHYNPTKRYSPGYENNGNQLANEPPLSTNDNDPEIFIPKSESLSSNINQSIFNGMSIPEICHGKNYIFYKFYNKKISGACTKYYWGGIICKTYAPDTYQYTFSKNNLQSCKDPVFGTSIWPFTLYSCDGSITEATGDNTQVLYGNKSPARTDCNNPNYCTLKEERINIANWKKYHSTRILAAKTGIGAAFASQPDTFRLGYSTIYASAQTQINRVGDWTSTQKTNFYTWLNGLTANGATPLRIALDTAGKYFKDRNGGVIGDPYNSNPAVAESTSSQLSCRRSHTILVTDGAWNDTLPSNIISIIGNSDNTTGPEIALNNSNTKYRYIPGDKSDSRNLGKQDLLSGSDQYPLTLADVALYYWSRDLRASMANDASPGTPTDAPFWQNMTTHTAGFGTAGQMTSVQISAAKNGTGNWYITPPSANANSTLDDLIHAAHNGGGQYLQITDALSFATQVGELIGKITSELLSQAGLAVSSNELATTTKKFIPYYTSGAWWGNLKMQSMDADGNPVVGTGDWQVVATDASGTPTGVTTIPPVFSTNSLVPARNVFTMQPGTTANTAASLFSAYTNTSITTDVNAFLRGDTSKEGTNFRKRASIMGDITNSTPTFIKNVSDFGYDKLPGTTAGAGTPYTTYMTLKKNRTEGVVFVGANDGMLHGFREGSASVAGGAEVFAYVPRGVLGTISKLSEKTYVHQYFVDGPITEVDAYISAPTPANTGATAPRWANLIVGSLGAGGRSVFAIDVTTPVNSISKTPTMSAKSVLWEYDSSIDTDVGNVMGEVQTGVTKSGDWVAVFGNGKYSNTGSSGKAYLYVLNLSTGALMKKIATNANTSNGLGAVRLVRDDNNMVIGAYAGDLQGNMWRFNLTASTSSSWPASGELLYTARVTPSATTSTVQAISAAPEVIKLYQYYDASSVLQLSTKPTAGTAAGYMVTFGTGKLYDTPDQADTSENTGYGIWDKATFCVEVTAPATNPNCSVPKFSGVSVPLRSNLVPATLGALTVAPSGSQKGGTYYSTTAARPVVWATDRGWYIIYTKSGQRTIYPFKQFVDSVVVSTIIPRLAATSCDANTPEGMNLIINPLTGACPVRYLIDSNGDGKIDTTDDPSAILDTNGDGKIDGSDSRQYCGWVAAVTGPPAFIKKTVTDPITNFKKIEASFLTPDGKKTMYFPNQSLVISRRDWRQIFPRQ